MIRIGHGYDVHALVSDRALILGGVTIPFDRGDLVSLLHRVGEIISEEHGPDGTRLKARVPNRHAAAFAGITHKP